MEIQSDGMKAIKDAENSMLQEYDMEMLEDITIEKKKSPFELVQFMFSSVFYEKPLLFSQSFLAEQFFEDIMKVQQVSNTEIQGEEGELYFIQKINRNGKLENVQHLKTTENFFKGTADVKIEILYSDGKSVNLTLKLKNISTGKESKFSHYYISTSVWDIIDQIDR